MKPIKVPTNVTRFIGRCGLKLKKYTPEILVVTGVIGTVASTVMACKATAEVSEILEESKNQIDQVHKVIENDANGEKKYSEEDGKKAITIVYAQTGLKLAKLYAPAIAVGALSVTSILAGTNIFRKRNLALAAAYTALDGSFKDYRNNVIERFGKELDRELRYNIKAEEVEEVVVDENGNETVVKKTVNVAHSTQYSPYAKIWYEGNPGWTKDPEYNLMYLRRQQDYANELFQAKGHIFLNEVYDILGFDRTREGQSVGWVLTNPSDEADHFIDFGIYDIRNANFVNGRERSLHLDFNVDGPILDLI